MTAPHSLPFATMLEENLASASPDLLRQMVKTFAEAMMSADVDAACGAEYGMPSEERINSRNRYRHRDWDTRVGTIDLAIPKVRSGSYFPGWLLERRRRSEQALISVVATCYLLGVSTRRVEKLAESLGVTQLSKSQVSEMAKVFDARVAEFRNRPLDGGPYTFVWVDALTQKVREGGRVVNVHALVAVGVDADGHREILRIDIASSEDGAGWLAFLRSLAARGLTGVQLVVSDAHVGLVNAIGAALPGAAWQRCRTHYARNLLSQVPRAPNPGWPPCCGPSSSSPTPTPCAPRWPRPSPPSTISSPRPPSTWKPPARTSSPSPPTPARCGSRSGPTVRIAGRRSRVPAWPVV